MNIPTQTISRIFDAVIDNYPAIRASGMTATEAVEDLIAAWEQLSRRCVTSSGSKAQSDAQAPDDSSSPRD